MRSYSRPAGLRTASVGLVRDRAAEPRLNRANQETVWRQGG